jgi:putative N6-adenine-specific DNA methylase
VTEPRACFAIVAPGFEAVVVRELEALGARDTVVTEGGVEFRAGDPLLLAANRRLRAASRVIVRVAEFGARSFAELERRAKRIPWDDFVVPGSAVDFRVTCRKSRLYHSDAVAERLARSVPGAVPGESPQLFIVRMAHDVCTISADASGALLHRRGYRLATAKAPLRESIAAGCLLALGYDGTQALIDPMCGSGTIPIEAALIAQGIAPGAQRQFACERWPGFRGTTGGPDRGAVSPPGGGPGGAPILGSDRDAGAMAAASANAARAGVANRVQLEVRALSAIEPPAPHGILFTNPPYGARVGDAKALRNLYAQLGNVARRKFAGWRIALVSADRRLEAHTGLALEEVLRFSNGGIRVRLLATCD